MVKVEGTLEELKALLGTASLVDAKKRTAKKTPPTPRKKTSVKRAPSAYNKYMKKELARLKKAHPRMTHQARFKKAAKSWKRSKKGAKK